MMRIAVFLVALLAPVTLFAAEYEQLMLPIAPSVVHCGYESRYETRLLAYNADAEASATFCAEGRCNELRPNTGSELGGDYAGGTPLPAFLYVPKEVADDLRLSIMVESSERSRLDERAFTEIPVIRASQFREGKMQLVGVRMDPGFRQTVRMYGLDGSQHGEIMMRVFALGSGEKLHECVHYLSPLTSETTAEGLQLRPSFGMECDMSHHVLNDGTKVRIELESLTPGLKYWAFMSITNNKTQHFYTVLPH